MSAILNIETSTSVCSVAVSQDGSLLLEKRDLKGPAHNTILGEFIQEALSFLNSHAIPLDAVAVSCGPGSYTGLRIGVSMAKGICYGQSVPLLSIPTLEVLAVPALLYHEEEIPENALICPMLDARRMEVYAAVYDRALKTIQPTHAQVLDENSYREHLEKGPVVFLGPGALKAQKVITHPNALFMPDIQPLAGSMIPLAEKAVAEQRFADTAYMEPFYLKEFVATTPRKLL